MRVEGTLAGMQESDGSDYDSDDFIEYDENSIPEVKLFHKFCRPLKESPLPVGEKFAPWKSVKFLLE